MTTPLLHLGLLVRDQQRSLRFYATYFGFEEAGARRYPDGTVIVRNAQGFDLALHPGDPPERLPAFVHFGFQLPDASAVGALLARMEADGVPILERWDELAYPQAFQQVLDDPEAATALQQPALKPLLDEAADS